MATSAQGQAGPCWPGTSQSGRHRWCGETHVKASLGRGQSGGEGVFLSWVLWGPGETLGLTESHLSS